MTLLGAAIAKRLTRRWEAIPERFADFLRWIGRDPSEAIEAICDASEGRPVHSALGPKVFGCANDNLPAEPRRVVVVQAGGRGGKTSRLLAPKALHAGLTVPLPTLAPGEHAVSLIVAPRQLEALQALSFVRGILESRDELRALVVNRSVHRGAERLGAAECITIRRPQDGRLVDIRIGVASSGGLSARAKTLVFAGLDEAAFFRAEGELTDKALYQAAIQRVVPGGQVWMVSTPWIEGFGMMAELFQADFGRHEHTLCATGPTRLLNPTWDPDGTIEKHLRTTDPDNASREIDAIPLPAGSKLFFPPEVLAKAVNDNRPRHLEPDHRFTHYAGTDLGFRRNSSALGIARVDGKVVRLAYLEEVRPERGKPLVPSEVCEGFAEACARYSAWSVLGDLHYSETAREHFGVARHRDPADRREVPHLRSVSYVDFIPTIENVSDAFARVRDMMADGRIELPKDDRLLSELRRTTSRPMPGGAVKVELPRVGNAHGDLAMACVLAMSRYQDGSYARKLEELARRAAEREQSAKPKTRREEREAAALDEMRRMTRMPKAG